MPSRISSRLISLYDLKEAFGLSSREFFDAAASLSAEAMKILNPLSTSKKRKASKKASKTKIPIDKNMFFVIFEGPATDRINAEARAKVTSAALADKIGHLTVDLEDAKIYLWHVGIPMVKSIDGFALDEYFDFISKCTKLPPWKDKPYTTYGKLRDAFDLYPGEVTNMVMDLSSIPRRIVQRLLERDRSQLKVLIDDTTVDLGEALYYLWERRIVIRNEVEGLSFDGYHQYLKSQNLAPIRNPQARPCIDPVSPNDLIITPATK